LDTRKGAARASARLGASPQTPGIYRFRVEIWLFFAPSEEMGRQSYTARYLDLRVGARVASLRCPILRSAQPSYRRKSTCR